MRPRTLLFWTLACLLSLACAYKATYQQLSNTKILEEKRDDLAAEVNGTADRPYVFRILTPLLVRTVQSIAPNRSLPGGVGVLVHQRCSPTLPCGTLAAYSLVAPTLFFLFLVTVYAAGRRILLSDIWAFAAVLLAFSVANALLLRHLSHIYDFGTLFFAALLLLTASYRTNALFFAVIMLASTNKESLILYAFSFAAITWAERGRRVLVPFALQVAGFLVVYTLIKHHFAHNPGTPVQIHLSDWVDYLGTSMTLSAVLLTLLALWLVFADLAFAPPLLRRASVILIPWLALLFIGGGPGELRVIFEVLPLLVLLVCSHLRHSTHPLSGTTAAYLETKHSEPM